MESEKRDLLDSDLCVNKRVNTRTVCRHQVWYEQNCVHGVFWIISMPLVRVGGSSEIVGIYES